ncbi:hypothetical protein CMO91_05325 [Candidatus Woesearchaeota archaeon]|nr:hypothetical protein [Candidatus Woesearchaeota archaeon]|tara:strand:- start:377 stop:949 length:573 start_codon:yes stop_codon:yes gene_type:complete
MRFEDPDDRIRSLENQLRELKSQRPSWFNRGKQALKARLGAVQEHLPSKQEVKDFVDWIPMFVLVGSMMVFVVPPTLVYDNVRKYVVPRIPLVSKKTRGAIVAERMWQVHANSFCYSAGEFIEPKPDHLATFPDLSRRYLREARQTVCLCDRTLRLLGDTDYEWKSNIESRRADADRYVREYGPVIEQVA